MAEVTLVPRKDVDRDDWNSFVDRIDTAWLWHRQELIDALLTWPGSSDASVAGVRPGGMIVAVVPLLGWRRPVKGIVKFVDLAKELHHAAVEGDDDAFESIKEKVPAQVETVIDTARKSEAGGPDTVEE